MAAPVAAPSARPAVSETRMPRRARAARRASVLVIVMVTLLFATFALLAFMEKAGVDLLVEQREAVTRRLRGEAYSALEVTLGVLHVFNEVGGGLRSPSEGWDRPLEFAGYTPSDDRVVEITFDDESGKIPLPRVNAQVLTLLFHNWGVQKTEAEDLADALLGWMKPDHIATSSVRPDYDSGPVPYEAPGRSLRSYHELAAIEKVRDFFYESDGRPNPYWHRFVDAVSLLDFARPNLNGAKPDTLAAVGQLDQTQMQNVTDFLRGTGNQQFNGPGFFRDPGEAARLTGAAGNTAGFSATISALRINVVVREGRNEYKLMAIVAPPGGATTVQQTAVKKTAAAAAAKTASQQQNRPNATQTNPRPGGANNPAARTLKYPFTLLEIRENDDIPSAPGATP